MHIGLSLALTALSKGVGGAAAFASLDYRLASNSMYLALGLY